MCVCVCVCMCRGVFVCAGGVRLCVCDMVIAAVSSRNVYLLGKLNPDL